MNVGIACTPLEAAASAIIIFIDRLQKEEALLRETLTALVKLVKTKTAGLLFFMKQFSSAESRYSNYSPHVSCFLHSPLVNR